MRSGFSGPRQAVDKSGSVKAQALQALIVLSRFSAGLRFNRVAVAVSQALQWIV